jgi:hypothetical protein
VTRANLNKRAGAKKNHTELRQKLPKGTSFESLDAAKMSDITEAINSTPRRSLCGMSPIEMLYKVYGKDVQPLLEHLGIKHLCADDIDLGRINAEDNK